MEKYQSSSKNSYILGISLTIEAIRQIPEKMECVYLSSKALHNSQYEKLISLCAKENIPVLQDDRVIEKLSVKENCYGIGVFRKFNRPLSGDKHIVLYHFTDPGELGTIFRSAVSFDFKDIVLIDAKIDWFSPRVVRASMGSIFHLNIVAYPDLDTYFSQYRYHLYPFISNGKEFEKTILETPYSILIPQRYHDLDLLFKEGYRLNHKAYDTISLSSLSAIVFHQAYDQNGSGKNSVCTRAE